MHTYTYVRLNCLTQNLRKLVLTKKKYVKNVCAVFFASLLLLLFSAKSWWVTGFFFQLQQVKISTFVCLFVLLSQGYVLHFFFKLVTVSSLCYVFLSFFVNNK